MSKNSAIASIFAGRNLWSATIVVGCMFLATVAATGGDRGDKSERHQELKRDATLVARDLDRLSSTMLRRLPPGTTFDIIIGPDGGGVFAKCDPKGDAEAATVCRQWADVLEDYGYVCEESDGVLYCDMVEIDP